MRIPIAFLGVLFAVFKGTGGRSITELLVYGILLMLFIWSETMLDTKMKGSNFFPSLKGLVCYACFVATSAYLHSYEEIGSFLAYGLGVFVISYVILKTEYYQALSK